MRFFDRPMREAAEGPYLTEAHGKVFEPFGYLTVAPAARLGTAGVQVVDFQGERLAVHGDSASWAFLNDSEADFYRALGGQTYAWAQAAWPGDAPSRVIDFVASLYRRGLLTIEGTAAVDRRLFADGPNYDEGNLVELLVTEKCNLACPYCLAGANAKMPSMFREMAIRTIDLAFANDTDTLAFEFAGGEPFIKFPLMRELVEHIQRHPLRGDRRVFLSVQTNATLLDEERVRWLRDNDVRVGISVEGGEQAQNAGRPTATGRPSYPALMKGIDLLQRFEVPFGGLVVLNRANVGDPGGLADFLVERGINGFRLNPVAYLGDARHNWLDVGLTQQEIIGFLQALLLDIIERRLPLLEDNTRTMCDFLTSRQRRTRCMRAECGAGDTFQAVTANGDIYPCGRSTQSPGLKLGNVFDEGLRSLDQAARSHPVMVELRARRPDDFDTCRVCPYRQLCQAGCSAQAWERHGTVRHKTPECDFYKTMYPWLMHRLSFEPSAFEHLERMTYLNREGRLFVRDFLRPLR